LDFDLSRFCFLEPAKLINIEKMNQPDSEVVQSSNYLPMYDIQENCHAATA